MDNMKTILLLAYFDRLINAEKAGHKCSKETNECIEAVRKELGLGTDVSKLAQTLAKRIHEGGISNA